MPKAYKACPVCGTSVRSENLEKHVWKAHPDSKRGARLTKQQKKQIELDERVALVAAAESRKGQLMTVLVVCAVVAMVLAVFYVTVADPFGWWRGTSLTAPSAPQSVQAIAGNGQVNLVWSPPASDGGSRVTGYRVYGGTFSNPTTLLSNPTTESFVHGGLPNGVKYYYRIRAVNSIGEGPPSAEVQATPSSSATSSVATMTTAQGTIRLQLYPDKAPVTCQNFVKYVSAAFYDGLVFHRIYPGFMIQGGGFKSDKAEKTPLYPPIVNEAKTSGLKNVKYSVAMARTSDPNSATCQFFINVVDNPSLDPGGSSAEGYAVFAQVVGGTDVVDKIAALQNDGSSDGGRAGYAVPPEAALINSIRMT